MSQKARPSASMSFPPAASSSASTPSAPTISGDSAHGYADVARSMLDRFRYGMRRSASQSSPADTTSSKPVLARYGSSLSQYTTYETGSKLRALDINSTRTHVVLAGRRILKTFHVDDVPNCVEDFDIRTATVNFPWGKVSGHDGPSNTKEADDLRALERETFDIEDVAWSNNVFSDYIATAARNGKIMVYNMRRPDIDVARLHEHLQQVHKVDFNPLEGGVLLSGSQDGTVRLWDLRSLQRSEMLCTSRDTYLGRRGAVRHVKWSPISTWTFAFNTDSGTIQRWDTRKATGPIHNFPAHDGHCSSLDWHPDGRHLASAGRDKTVKIWNMASHEKSPKPIWYIRMPHEIQNVRWRPSCNVTDSPDSPDLGRKQCTHLATSYRKIPVVHVWDLRRPHLPFREIHHLTNTGTTDMLWRSRDLLWTVGPEGDFTQTDVSFAPKTIDRRPMSVLGCSPLGEVSFYTRKRPQQQSLNIPSKLRHRSSHTENGRRPTSSEKIVLGRSPGDDSFEAKFLSTSSLKRSRTPSVRSIKSLATTSPSIEDTAKTDTVDLNTTMSLYNIFDPSQVHKQGPLPGSASTLNALYMAQKWKNPPIEMGLDLSYILNIRTLFEKNARYAQYASRYRDAQTWRMFGAKAERELRDLAESNRKLRLDGKKKSRLDMGKNGVDRLRSPSGFTAANHPETASKNKVLKGIESHSNMSTPRMRPTMGPLQATPGAQRLPGELEGDLQLPPSLVGSVTDDHTLTSAYGLVHADESFSSDDSLLEAGKGANWERLAAERDATIRPQKRIPFTLDSAEGRRSGLELATVDSQDNILMFGTSNDSEPRLSKTASFVSHLSPSSGESALSGDSPEYKSKTHPKIMRNDSELGAASSVTNDAVSLVGNCESFVDLPQHGNMRVDDFIDHQSEDQDNDLTNELQEPSVPDSHAFDSNDMDFKDQAESDEAQVAPDSPRENTRPRILQLEGNKTHLSHFVQPMSIPLTAGPTRNEDHEKHVLLDFFQAEHESAGNGAKLLTAKAMLYQLLIWYTNRSDSQMASQLFLSAAPLLAPVDPSLSTIDSRFPASPSLDFPLNLTAHHLSSPAALLKILDIDPTFAESFLSTYHEQLLSLDLLNAAATLRRLACPAFPAVYEQGLKDVSVGMLCGEPTCKKPINNPTNKMYCENCHAHQAECPICCSNESPFNLPSRTKRPKLSDPTRPQDQVTTITPFNSMPSSSNPSSDNLSSMGGESHLPSTITALWSTCTTCNHATHASCAQAWFSDPSAEGACPIAGCLCDCLPGAYRDQRLAKIEAAARKKRALLQALRREEGRAAEFMVSSPGNSNLNSAEAFGGGGGSGSEAIGRQVEKMRGALKAGRAVGMVSGSGVGEGEGEGEKMEEGKRVRILT